MTDDERVRVAAEEECPSCDLYADVQRGLILKIDDLEAEVARLRAENEDRDKKIRFQGERLTALAAELSDAYVDLRIALNALRTARQVIRAANVGAAIDWDTSAIDVVLAAHDREAHEATEAAVRRVGYRRELDDIERGEA